MTAQSSTAPAQTNPNGRFGTFGGVFVPNVLTILGIILFLRIGWVVGQTGLWGALIIIALANSISLLTGLSLSAIATSMEVRAGGNYYLISRSLGLEIGGAIGIPLFLSQAISVAFYIIGFTEALMTLEFFQSIDPRLISTLVVLVFAVISWIGADFALKIQYFILAILVAALISFFAGGWDSFQTPLTASNFTPGVTFWIAFAVFFPAVTGIEVGTSLSGDLKNPSKSIPQGTLLSIIITAIIYFGVAIWFALHLSAQELISNNMAMQQISLLPMLILLGVWASTLSSALGSIIAAPRTLQAIATDNVVPIQIASRLGSKTEPRMAILITGAIALSVIWMGDLNFVAPVISMFFLNTYGMVNLAAGIEKLVANPSFRPKLRIPWYMSILGALGCYGAMFLINAPATIAAIIISYGIFFYLEHRQLQRTWGDLRSGIWFSLARWALLNLEAERWHAKNWRPNLIVFTGQPFNREPLVRMSEWLSMGQGIVTFFQLIVGDVSHLAQRGLRETARKHIRSYIQNRNMTAFAEAEIVSDFKGGAIAVAQAHGIGGLEANSVLLGWSRVEQGQAMQMELLRGLTSLHKSVMFLYFDQAKGFGEQKIINVWWRGGSSNAGLMLLLAHIIQRHRSWHQAKIRILRIIDHEEGTKDTHQHLKTLLTQVRVEAEPIVIVRPDPKTPLTDIMADWSKEADLTLLGMELPEEKETESYSRRLNSLIQAIGTVLLIRNSEADKSILRAE